MATTSIWRVGGWLGKVVIYVENPDKTENPAVYEKSDMEGRDAQGLSDVIEYAVQQQKTEKVTADDEGTAIMQRFVSGVNCSPTTARDEMIAVKKRFGKEDGTVAYHGYQSFAPGEADPQTAHEIGLKLAKKLWGEKYQVVVATHLDKSNHLHNHFVVNTVSFVDGIKYHRTEKDYYDMQRESDRLCREYGLSVIENPQRGKYQHYGAWRAEQEGRPTYLSLIKADVDTAIRQSMTERQFFYHLKQMGYDIKVGKDITLRAPGRENGRKLCRNLGEEYSLESIRRRILAQSHPQRTYRPQPRRCRFHGDLKQARKVTGFRALYFHYCYLLGVFPEKQNRQPRRVSHACREDLIRAKELTDEARLLSRHRIDTLEQLTAHRTGAASEMNADIEQRKALYRRLRTKEVLSAPEQQEQIKADVDTAIRQSMTERQFFYHLKQMGYDIKVGKDITLRAPGRENGRKLCRNLGEEYSLESIRRRILAQSHPQRTYRPQPRRCRFHGDLKQARKVTGFRALYFHYCYLLGVFPEKQNRQPRRVSHACREDLIRAKELTDEARLLSRHRIDTLEQLTAHRTGAASEMNADIEQRKALYRRLRTKEVLSAPEQQEQIKAEIAVLSGRIKELRREVRLCEDIAVRSLSIKEKIKAAREEARTEQGTRQGPERGRAGIPGRR